MYVSPNRENLRFSVKKVKKEQQLEELHWLIELIKQHAKDTPKTLIFCNTLNEIAQVTNYLLSKLGPHAYDQQNKVPQNCFLGVYHSNSWDRNKERISDSLKARNGSIKRVVVATTALCMGVNFPDIRYIALHHYLGSGKVFVRFPPRGRSCWKRRYSISCCGSLSWSASWTL